MKKIKYLLQHEMKISLACFQNTIFGSFAFTGDVSEKSRLSVCLQHLLSGGHLRLSSARYDHSV